MTHPYATRQYAQIAAGSCDTVTSIPSWKQYVVRRSVGDVASVCGVDAAGCYPVSPFEEDIDLLAGFEALRSQGCVSVVIVADPVLRPCDRQLSDAFDICRPFKTHYLYDRRKGPVRYSKHHRYEVRRAGADVRKIDLAEHLDEWVSLYCDLVQRHSITGSAAFSDRALKAMSRIDGLVTFGAFVDDQMVACHLWLRAGETVHSHLAASNSVGRGCGAAYSLYDRAIRHFADAKMIDFGGAAGLIEDPRNGLARFKRGFANASAPTYLCGKILDRKRYDMLSAAMETPRKMDYFPAYRAPSNYRGRDV